MEITILIFLAVILAPSVLLILYIRRVIRVRQEIEREKQRRLEAYLRRQKATIGNPKSVSRRAP